MKFSPIGLVIFLVQLFNPIIYAQQAAGLFYDNYVGIHGVVKNPASGQHGRLGWDVNIGSAHLYGRTTYGSIINTSLFDLVGGIETPPIFGDDEMLANSEDRGIVFNDGAASAYAHVDIMGPSFWIDLKPIGIGGFVRGRVDASAPDVPSELSYSVLQNLAVNAMQSIGEVQSAGAAWTEYGLSLSSNSFGYDDISVGINVKYLQGHEGYHISSPGNFDFNRTVGNQLEINTPEAILAFTDGFRDVSNLSRSNAGNGWAIDIGYSKQFLRSRLGISILDIGRIQFNNGSVLHRLALNEAIELDIDELSTVSSIEELIEIVDIAALNSTLVDNSFTVRTPARLLINYDYHVDQYIYINGVISQSLATSNQSIRSENNVTISPRYERRWLAVTVPVTVNSYESVHLGLAARFGPVTIGTDNLHSLFGDQAFNGSSVYAAVRVYPFRDSKHSRGVECPRIKRSPWDSAKPVKGAERMRSPR
jgi:hypothetical protein